MAIFLQVRAGQIHLLLDALSVHEILGLDALAEGGGAHCEWRSKVLQSLNLGEFLGSPSEAPGMGVVYTPLPDAQPIMLKVDEVLRLRELRTSDWSVLPRLPQKTLVFFDAIHVDAAANQQIYRLRSRLAPELFAALPLPDEAQASAELALADPH
jgi:hypothetical protein